MAGSDRFIRWVRMLLVAACQAAGPLASAAPALAQSAPATISGQVTDETGGVLPGATVVMRHSAGRERTVVTDGRGQFSADQLLPGSYLITVTLSGFETLTRDAVDVGDGGTTRLTLM